MEVILWWATNKKGFGVGVLLLSPNETYNPIAIKLNFEATNNITKYEACIFGLVAALELGIEEIKVYITSFGKVKNQGWETITI